MAALTLIIIVSVARSVYTDLLWFDNVGYRSVFTKVLTYRMALFILGFTVFAVFAAINVGVAYALSHGEILLPVPPESVRWLRRMLVLATAGGTVLAAVVFGLVAARQWPLFLYFQNAVPFNQADPLHGKDISFFFFRLPVYNFTIGWLLGAVIVTMLGVLGIHVTNAVLRGQRILLTRPLHLHLAVLGAVAMVLIAVNHFLGTYEVVFSNRGAAYGAAYTDVHARLLALRVLAVVALAGAAMLLASVWAGGPRLAAGAVVLWIGAGVVVGQLYPAAVQQFVVNPNELTKEREYIERNITATRDAFALTRIDEQAFPFKGGMTREIADAHPGTMANLRLWDHPPLKDTYNQIQFFRLYYSFKDVDVDRYTVDGQYKQVMLSARELYPTNLPTESQNWINQRLQYTHGYGMAMSPVTEQAPDGRPVFYVKDIPPQGAFPVTRPEIYFGENTSNFVLVNTRELEFDYPLVTEGEDRPVYTRYQGQGGVQLSSWLRRVAYAWQMADLNLLISPQVTTESRIQYRRNVQERVTTIAPFLRLDDDPYLVLADGKLYFIQDAYTVSNRYPYSTPFGEPANHINYIRNSVKAVVDAYDGSVTFYVADTTDPMIKMYSSAFPGVFRPLDSMGPSLQAHLRYPEGFFKVQARMYLQYHMRDANVFFNQEDLWSVPNEQFFGKSQPLEPYYVIMRLPGETREEFVEILPFTPSNKPNLVGWMAARSDAPNYGRLMAFTLPRGSQVDGTSQIEARIDNDPVISQQFTLWGQAGSTVIRGNLLVVPVQDRLLYVEPIYLQSSSLAFPELRRVILATSDRVVMEPSVEAGLAVLVGAKPPTPPSGDGGTQPPPSSLQQQIDALAKALDGVKSSVNALEQALQALRDLAQQQAQPTPTPVTR